MNEELIQILMEERDKLYPNGDPIRPRGCSKPNVYIRNYLRWWAYESICNVYKYSDDRMSINDATKRLKILLKSFGQFYKGDRNDVLRSRCF